MQTKELSRSLDYFKRAGSPIVAEATATGGPVSILRVSGKNLEFLSSLFSKGMPELRLATYDLVADIDRSLILYFKGPKSFTGEDVIEVHCHGVPSVVEAIKRAICQLGAREALPGEFSFRAYLNEKLSLEEASALNDALSFENLSAEAASRLLAFSKGSEESAQNAFRDFLAKLYAARGRVESAIEFPEAEEEQSADVEAAGEKIDAVLAAMSRVETLYENFAADLDLPRVGIVGESNVGKSTLFNNLCGSERSLVSQAKGTTRDYLEAIISSEKLRFRLIDTAGFRELSRDQSEHAQIERLGMEKGLEVLKGSQLLLWVQSSQSTEGELHPELRGLPCLKLYSFADRSGSKEALDLRSPEAAEKVLVRLSSELLAQRSKMSSDSDLVLSSRQLGLMRRAKAHIIEARQRLASEEALELVAQELQNAEVLLKQCLGEDLGEEYIGEIFSQFCLGK